jgi:hypothetical protein
MHFSKVVAVIMHFNFIVTINVDVIVDEGWDHCIGLYNTTIYDSFQIDPQSSSIYIYFTT